LPQLLAAAAAVGLRPCSGAILVLLFTLANQIYLVGVVASFAMGAGVAITVAGVSLASQGLQRFFDRAGGEGLRARRLQRLAGFVGALLITAFGLLQLLAIWSGALTPMAG